MARGRLRASLQSREAGEGDVTFFGNPKYLAQIKASRATAILVPADFSEPIPSIPVRVENPSLSFARLVEIFAPPPWCLPRRASVRRGGG